MVTVNLMRNRTFAAYWSGTLALQLVNQIQTLLFAWSWSQLTSDNAFWVYFATNIPFALLTLFVGYLGDKFSRKGLHLIGQVFVLAGLILAYDYFSHAVNFTLGLLSLLLMNTGIAIRGPSYQATIISLFPVEKTESVLSVHGMAVNIARLLSPRLLALILRFNLPTLPAAIGAIATLWAAFTIVVLDKGAWLLSHSGEKTSPALQKIPFKLIGIAYAVAFCCCSLQVLTPSIAQNYTLLNQQVPVISAFSMMMGLGAIGGTLFVHKLPRISASYQVAALLMLYALLLLMTFPAELTSTSISMLICGLCTFVILVKLNVLFTRTFSPQQRAFGLSVYFFSVYLGAASGSIFWGMLAHRYGINHSLFISAVAGGALSLYFYRYFNADVAEVNA